MLHIDCDKVRNLCDAAGTHVSELHHATCRRPIGAFQLQRQACELHHPSWDLIQDQALHNDDVLRPKAPLGGVYQ